MNTSSSRPKPLLCCAAAIAIVCAPLCSAQQFSRESNLFDLTANPVHCFFAGESGIFSLRGVEGTYVFALSASYSTAQQTARVVGFVYDPQRGIVVSVGAGHFRLSQAGQTALSGNLTYSSSTRLWDSGAVAFAGAGRYTVVVSINGQAFSTALTVPSTAPVHLVGIARNGVESPVADGTVKLYDANAVLSAPNLNSLPPPLTSTPTPGNGSFDFGNRPLGQYVLALVSPRGTTIGRPFWLRSGETTHSETIVENPGRTALLNNVASLRDSIQAHVVETQTVLMKAVADTVDADLDGNPELADWALLIGNIVSGSAAGLAKASAKGALTVSSSAKVVAEKSADNLLKFGIKTGSKLGAVELTSIDTLSRVGQCAALQPFFMQEPTATQEWSEMAAALSSDVPALLDPRVTSPFLDMTFSRDNQVRKHSSDWYDNLASYQFAHRWLDTYYSQAVQDMPALAPGFSIVRANALLTAAELQMTEIESGSRLVFVGSDSAEWTSTSATLHPLPLNLLNSYRKYQTGRGKKDTLKWISRGSSAVAIGAQGVAFASAAGVISAPAAPVAEAVALGSSAVSLGASVAQASVMADMVSTYGHMSAQYPANLLTAPLALKRTKDFIVAEAGTPYYLNVNNQFAGTLGDASLGGTAILGREVFFPLEFTLLPFLPPIQFTGEKLASMGVTNKPGSYSSAGFRVESKVTDFSGVHDHVVISVGQLSAGQNARVQVPFRGHLQANGILSAGTFETRLWVGPFQKSIKTKDFFVVPINLGFPTVPLRNVRTKDGSPTGEEIMQLADRVRERYETNLVVGTNALERTYTFSNDVFECEFRLYRPPEANVSFKASLGGEYIGWDSVLEGAHYGFPGDYSGKDANPEWIKIPNCNGQTITVSVELNDVTTEPVNLLLEVREKPMRSAMLVALPDSVNLVARTGSVHSVEIAVGESSHQQPLQGVSVSMSPLTNVLGNRLFWTNASFFGVTNIAAGGVSICAVSVNTSNAVDGTYKGTVVVTATNAGTIQVPVSVTVDARPPETSLMIKEWWHAANGPLLTWGAQDNVSGRSSLSYSVFVQGWDTNWTGFSTTTNRDLSEIPNGDYRVFLAARDQALNESLTNMVLHVDRDGQLWKQRIVDFDPNDGITNASQFAWMDDFDQDGANNREEYLAGTDPTNPSDRFIITSVTKAPAGTSVRWFGKRGFTYRVLKLLNLGNGVWTQAPSGSGANEKSQQQAGNDGVLEYVDVAEGTSKVFYRVQTVEGN